MSPAGPSAPWTWCFKARKPYSFVERHHVPEPIRTFGAVDVVLQSPQTLIPSSGGTTPPGSAGPSVPWTCASRPANPYSFVERHHVPEPIRAFGAVDVVLQGPQNLIPSSGGTTPPGSAGPSEPWTWCFKARNDMLPL